MKLSKKKKNVIFNTIEENFKSHCEKEGIDFSGSLEDMFDEQKAVFATLTDFIANLGEKIIQNLESEKPSYS